MQELAQQVTPLRAELVNCDASVGELAWLWGMGQPNAVRPGETSDTWRGRLWHEGTDVVGWGWAYLPYRGVRSDGQEYRVETAYLAWQVHPSRPAILDEILDWYDALVPQVDHRVGVRAANDDAIRRLTAHGYRLNSIDAADDGSWTQANVRDLADLSAPVLPDGYRFRSAEDVSAEAALQAHISAWHPSTLTLAAVQGAQRTWPYRPDLHVLVEAPDGTLVASTIMWLDERNRTAEFEPVGTHKDYRRRKIGAALLYHGMARARQAGATTMTVACLGGAAHPAAKGLYYSVGFREFTRDLPHIKPAPA